MPRGLTLVLFMTPAVLVGACAAPAPRIAYTPSGMAGNAVFFVEERVDGDREYVVLCHPNRTPPCARVAPTTIRSREELDAWVETQEAYQRRQRPAPRPRVIRQPTPPPAISPGPGPEAADWANASAVVGAPRAPGEEAPTAAVPGVGTVNLITPGGWANVYDDEGHFLGQTPIQLQLREGTQSLSLRPFGQPPGDSDPIQIEVRPGETVSIVRRLEEPPGS